MQATDAQVRKLMEEFSKHGQIERAGLQAGLGRHTAAKYIDLGKLPSELTLPRTWRTREDPFASVWAEVVALLEVTPELEAKTIFDLLVGKYPGRFEPGQLRTLQRHVRVWRAQEGPPKEIFFPQQHRPGEAMQTDFTWANELHVTIGGEVFQHMLCHPCLPYSNWEWATVCLSESTAALKRGVQATLFRLGKVPPFHQTDHSTAATHDISGHRRGFNDEYLAFMQHFGMTPRTIAVGEKHQNGDVEASHGALKRRLDQHLIVRGSRDFETVPSYEKWVQNCIERANALREEKLREELALMKSLPASRFPEFVEISTPVTSWGTVRIKNNSYSVPSRLCRELIRARVFEDRVEIYHAGVHQLTVERIPGRARHRINYRHVIHSLVRKPGAFRRYRYREDLFPSLVFRHAYDRLCESLSEYKADLEYLRILRLAADTLEASVETALLDLEASGQRPDFDAVSGLIVPKRPELPAVAAEAVDLSSYDELLASLGAADVPPGTNRPAEVAAS